LIVGPSPEAKQAGETKKELAARHHMRHEWWSELVKRDDAKMHSHINPGNHSYLGTSSGIRGLSFNYVLKQKECGAELYIDRGAESDDENLAIFEQISGSKTQIEQAVSEPISWEPLDGRRACRIRINIPGGYSMPREQWADIQARVVRAMTELEGALRPVLANLNLGN